MSKPKSPSVGVNAVVIQPIFSGDYSRDMWDDINAIVTAKDARDALYFVCCRLQELESRLNKLLLKDKVV